MKPHTDIVCAFLRNAEIRIAQFGERLPFDPDEGRKVIAWLRAYSTAATLPRPDSRDA